MLFENSINQDLVWQFANRRYKESSIGFLHRLKESLCLFSQTVGQLYLNYDLFSASSRIHNVMAMPNYHYYHEIYNDITKQAVRPTGIYVIPTEIQRSYLPGDLCIAYRSLKTGRFKTIPLHYGLMTLQKKFKDKGKFLPVIINKDLMFSKSNKPIMHLHRLDIERLDHLSSFQRKDITSAIEEKVHSFIIGR